MMKIEVRTQCDLRFSRCLLYFWMRKCFPILTAEIVQVMIAVKVKKAEKNVCKSLCYCVVYPCTFRTEHEQNSLWLHTFFVVKLQYQRLRTNFTLDCIQWKIFYPNVS